MKKGTLYIPSDATPWQHEFATAITLTKAGYTVEFIKPSTIAGTKSADILINGIVWEIKAPLSSTLTGVERNLKRASKQSPNIIIDSHRMRKIRDDTVLRFLKHKLNQQRTIKMLWYITRSRKIIDIESYNR